MEDFAKPVEWLYIQHVCNAIQMYLAGRVDIDYYHNVIKDHLHHMLPESARESDIREYILEFLTCFEQAHEQKEEIMYKERYQFMAQGISHLELALQSADDLPASSNVEAKEILKKLIDKVSARTVIASSRDIAESRVLYKRYKGKMTSPQQHACECVLKGLLPADKWLKSNTKYAEGIKDLVRKFMLLCPSTFLEKIVNKMDSHSKKNRRMTRPMKHRRVTRENGATSPTEVSDESQFVKNRRKLKDREKTPQISSSDELTSIQITNIKSMAPPESATKRSPPNLNQEHEALSDCDSNISKPGDPKASDVSSKYFTPEVSGGLQPLIKNVGRKSGTNVTSSPKGMPPPIFHCDTKPGLASPSRTKIGKDGLPTTSSKFSKIPIQFRKIDNALNRSMVSTSTACSSRTRRAFTTLQDAYIIMGVRKVGKRWIDIYKNYPFPEYRTPTHIKDRWRTLSRRGDVGIEDGNIVASDKYEAILTHVYRTMENQQPTVNLNAQPDRNENTPPEDSFDIDDLSDDDHETSSKRKTVLDWLRNKSNTSPTRHTMPVAVEKRLPQTSGAVVIASDDESLPSIHGLRRQSVEYVKNFNGKLLPNGRSKLSLTSDLGKAKPDPPSNVEDLARVSSREGRVLEPESRASSKISNASSGSGEQSEIEETPDLELPDSGTEKDSSNQTLPRRNSKEGKPDDGFCRDGGVPENLASPEQAAGSLSNRESTPVGKSKDSQSGESAASMSAELFKIADGSIHLELLPESDISFSSQSSSGDNSAANQKPCKDNGQACGSMQFFTAPDSPGIRPKSESCPSRCSMYYCSTTRAFWI